MILRQTFERMEPDTVNGHQLKVIWHYSSHDERQIDAVENSWRSKIGDGIAIEYDPTKILLKREVGGTDEVGN